MVPDCQLGLYCSSKFVKFPCLIELYIQNKYHVVEIVGLEDCLSHLQIKPKYLDPLRRSSKGLMSICLFNFG